MNIYIFIFLMMISSELFSTQELFINCGSDREYLFNEVRIKADNIFSDSVDYGYDVSIDNNTEVLRQKELFSGLDGLNDRMMENYLLGFNKYKIRLNNGTYSLSLYFMDSFNYNKDRRIQTYIIEGDTLLENYDIVANVGRAYMDVKRFKVEINDGILDIDALAIKGQTCLSLIKVSKIGLSNTIADPKILFQSGGYYNNIIDLEGNFNKHFSHFNIYRDSGNGYELYKDSIFNSKFIDKNVEIDKGYSYQIEAVNYWDFKSQKVETMLLTPISSQQSKLKIFEIIIDEESLIDFKDNIKSDKSQTCKFKYDGKVWENVRLRAKGNFTRRFTKTNFKLSFEEDNLFENQKHLSLLFNYSQSMMKNKILYSLKKDLGILTQKTEYIHLLINGEFQGVYLYVEYEDEYFLENNKLNDAEVIKMWTNMNPNDKNLKKAFNKRNKYKLAYTEILKFRDILNDSSNYFEKNYHKIFDYKSYFDNWIVANYGMDGDHQNSNYILIRDLKTNMWYPIFFDYNSPGVYSKKRLDIGVNKGFGSYNQIFDRLFKLDEIKYLYYNKYKNLVFNYFKDDKLIKKMDTIQSFIEDDVLLDLNKFGAENPLKFYNGVAYLRGVYFDRYEFLKTAFDSLEINYNPHEKLKLNEIDYVNTKLKIELRNENPFPYTYENVKIRIGNISIEIGDKTIKEKDYLTIDAVIDLDNNVKIRLYSNEVLLDSFSTDFSKDTLNFQRNYYKSGWTSINTSTLGKDNLIYKADTTLVFNEVMSNNQYFFKNEEGDYSDWIEIHNKSDTIKDLSGYYMSDNKNELYKWSIPIGVKINPHEYMIFWADKNEGDLHADFYLSKEGEELFLMGSQGINLIDSISIPKLDNNISFGRIEDGNQWGILEEPSPYLRNNKPNSIRHNSESKIRVYKDKIKISLDSRKLQSFEIYDMKGKRVLIKNSFYNETLDLKYLSSGIYFYKLELVNGSESGKFIIN